MNTRHVLRRVSQGIYGRIWRFIMMPAALILAHKKAHQRAAFYSLQDRFGVLYEKTKGYSHDKFLIPFWKEMNSRFEKAMLPQPPFSFLRQPVIRATMFGPYRSQVSVAALEYLERRVPKERLRILLEEDYAGAPVLVHGGYLASGNIIFHLYTDFRGALTVIVI